MTKTFRQQLRDRASLRRDFVSLLSMHGSMSVGDMRRVDSLLSTDRSINCPLVLFADPDRPLVFASNDIAKSMLAVTGRFGTYVDFADCSDKETRHYRFNIRTMISESIECLQRADSGLLIAAGHFGDRELLAELVVRAVSGSSKAVCVLVCHKHDFDRLLPDVRNMPLLDRMIVCKQCE